VFDDDSQRVAVPAFVVHAEGKERPKHREADLGLKANMKEWQAYEKLADIIHRAEAIPAAAVPDSSQTLDWFWTARYLP